MIDYSVRTSSRSRRIRLSVTARDGLTIIVPKYFDQSRIPNIISEKQQWIKRAVHKVQNSATLQNAPIILPARIILQSVLEEYVVVVEYHSRKRNRISVTNNIITLFLNDANANAGFTLLKKWIHQKSEEILLPWLRSVSSDLNLPYRSAVVRAQRTRWGSCSQKKNINLNRLLIFLPKHLVEYLFIHELCHTLEMNHSKRYWNLVEKYCPNYKLFDKELKNSSKSIQRWVY